jgi:hypothetical protein
MPDLEDPVSLVKFALLNGHPISDRQVQELVRIIDLQDDVIAKQAVYVEQLARIRRKVMSDSLP